MSVGGMKTKLEAVQLAVSAGIRTVILDGREEGRIPLAAAFKDTGTRFTVSKPAKM